MLSNPEQGPESRYVDWAALGERCRLWTFLAKFECIIIDDWQVGGCSAHQSPLRTSHAACLHVLQICAPSGVLHGMVCCLQPPSGGFKPLYSARWHGLCAADGAAGCEPDAAAGRLRAAHRERHRLQTASGAPAVVEAAAEVAADWRSDL